MTSRRRHLAVLAAGILFGCSCKQKTPAGNAPESGAAFDAGACSPPHVSPSCSADWCDIPAGCFVMGSPETEWGRGLYSEDQTAVTLTHSFSIQQHEVTQAEWARAGFDNPSGAAADGTTDCLDPTCPVGDTTWFEAVAYANHLSTTNQPPLPACYVLDGCTGQVGHGYACASVTLSAASLYDCPGYRLPTAAEWEYAARAGTTTAFYSGDITPQKDASGTCYRDENLESIAWYCNDSGNKSHPVGGKAPNPWGLLDVIGNAAEWTNDAATGASVPGPLIDPGAALQPAAHRVLRGGTFFAWSSALRAASRALGSATNLHLPGFGLRLVRTRSP